MAIPNKELFNRRGNSSDLLNREYRETHDPGNMIINSWDDFFKGVFGEPIGDPIKTQVYVKRHLPVNHPENPYGAEMVFPYQIGFFDRRGERWFGVLYDIGKRADWRFLLFKPDRETYLRYLMGEVTLLQLYQTTGDFYICNTEAGPDLFKVGPQDLTKEQLPLDRAYYGPNITFNPTDLFFGMNTAPVKDIQEAARIGKFF